MKNPGTITRLPEITVAYTTGDSSKPIPEQAPVAVERLETIVTSLRGKKFYGAVVDGEYRACVARDSTTSGLSLPEFRIPGGRYYCQRLSGFLENPGNIGALVATLVQRGDFDESRYVVEYYRAHDEISVRVPVL